MNPLRKARASGEEGLSLIELMIAVFVLAVSILALAGVATSSLMHVRVSRDRQRASDLASASLEEARGLDFDRLALASAGAPATAPPQWPGESLVIRPTGLLHAETVESRFSIRRWVTQLPHDTDMDDRRRVIITVAWNDRGTEREVTETTVVAPAQRGLPVPEFDIEPPIQVVTFLPGTGYTDAADPDPTTGVCRQHTITNLGAPDSYAWRLVNRQESNAVKTRSGPLGTYHDDSKKWLARAYFELIEPGATEPDLVPASRMTNLVTEATGPTWMESPTDITGQHVIVPSKRSAWLTICYWTSVAGGADVANVADYLIRVRSLFDNTIVESAVDRVAVANDPLVLTLHEDTGNHPGNWAGGSHERRKGNVAYPPLTMSEVSPRFVSHDMDAGTSEDTTGTHGYRLPVGAEGAAAVWDYPVTATREVKTATISLWARVNAVTTEADREAGRSPVLGYALERVTTDGSFISTIASGLHAFSGSTTEWQQRTIAPTVPAGSFVNAGQVLRLRVWCHSTSTSACHLNFDNNMHNSTLMVTR